MTEGQAAWQRACLALRLLSIDPQGLRGMVIRARSGPVREALVSALSCLKPPLLKLHPAMPRDALLGGLDLSQTLALGHLVETPGLLRQPGTWVLTMAERCPPDLAAILANALDQQPGAVLILLDEGAEPDERAPKVLTERLAFHVDLDGIGRLGATPPPRRKTPSIEPDLPEGAVATLTTLAARLGIHTMRAPLMAVAAMRARARDEERREASYEDLQIAAELVLAPAPHSSLNRKPTLKRPMPRPQNQPMNTKTKARARTSPKRSWWKPSARSCRLTFWPRTKPLRSEAPRAAVRGSARKATAGGGPCPRDPGGSMALDGLIWLRPCAQPRRGKSCANGAMAPSRCCPATSTSSAMKNKATGW